MSATTALELAVLGVGLVVLALAWLGRRPSRWDRAIAEHVRVTGRYPTAGEWRSGRIGEAARPKPTRPRPAPGPVTVTVTAVDGKPVAGAR
ncbi:MAG TPA: hypothetical protein VFP72_08640 [Kineosporiaceae bacterium]|nr:hypothetical protein [Kineosporiaceae bacterium]